MAKKGARQIAGLVCSVCKRQTYVTQRNRINTEEKIQLSKYCRFCRKHTQHKESSKLK